MNELEDASMTAVYKRIQGKWWKARWDRHEAAFMGDKQTDASPDYPFHEEEQ